VGIFLFFFFSAQPTTHEFPSFSSGRYVFYSCHNYENIIMQVAEDGCPRKYAHNLASLLCTAVARAWKKYLKCHYWTTFFLHSTLCQCKLQATALQKGPPSYASLVVVFTPAVFNGKRVYYNPNKYVKFGFCAQ